jgi:hypothetical protein
VQINLSENGVAPGRSCNLLDFLGRDLEILLAAVGVFDPQRIQSQVNNNVAYRVRIAMLRLNFDRARQVQIKLVTPSTRSGGTGRFVEESALHRDLAAARSRIARSAIR